MKKKNILTMICTFMAITIPNVNYDITLAKEDSTLELQTQLDSAVTKNLYTLEQHTGLNKAGASRGITHDKQDIGTILSAGSTIEVKLNETSTASKVTMEFLTDTKTSEKSIDVTSSWQKITTDHDVAVFFRTPFDVSDAAIDYKIIGESKSLPTYEYGTNENDFFTLWDSQDAEFALIKSDKMQMLVPKYAKENVRNLKDFDSVEALAKHYDEVINFSDYNLGLDNSETYHATTNSKYFIKEDKSTSAGGYYGGSYTVCAGGSFESFWLREVSWGQLHEINHGYQPNYNSIGIYTGEVSNNLYNIHYLKEYHGIDVIKNDWLFNYGKQEANENYIEEQLTAGTHYSSLGSGHRPALILLTMVDQKAGDNGLKELNQSHRRSYFDNTYEYLNLQDRLIQSYGSTSQYDFSPAIQRWNVPLDQEISETSRSNNYRPVAHLDHVVPKEYQHKVMETFDQKNLISSRFQVVDNDEIAFLGLTGNATVQLSDTIFNKLNGETMNLKDGNNIIASEVITDKNVTFNTIPNGVYSIDVSNKNSCLSNHYVYVKESENIVEMQEEQIDIFNFLGLGDTNSGSLIINSGENKQLSFNKSSDWAHSYFENELYYSVALYRDGSEVYTKDITGKNSEVIKDEIILQKNDVIKLYHAESKNRLLTKNPSLIDKNGKTHYIQVLDNELKQIDSSIPEIDDSISNSTSNDSEPDQSEENDSVSNSTDNNSKPDQSGENDSVSNSTNNNSKPDQSGKNDSVSNSTNNNSNATTDNENHDYDTELEYMLDIYSEKTTLLIGETQQMVAFIVPEPENVSVSWYGEHPMIADVSEDGLVTGKSAGEATIVVIDNQTGITKEIDITVLDQVLPNTGEKNSPILYLIGGLLLLASGTILFIKKTKNKK